MTPAIDVVGVSKRFRLYHEKYQSLKERVIHAGRVPYEDFWALRDVEIEIASGETFGLVGHNGSGKSTLLKCVAGIIRPTEGEIHVRGRLAAMLELGAGFHPELTGRENVYMNAAILGFSEREIDAKFDEIVAFSELEQFIDQQVKHYSSGMYVRLGFAVAVHMDPEILLVDEVLAVGDEAFQRKCLGRIRQFQREGRTIVLVTHNVDLLPQVCDRAAVLEHGRLLTVSGPGEAVRLLRERFYAAAAGEAERSASTATGGGVAGEGARAADDAPAQRAPSTEPLTPVRVQEITFDFPGKVDRSYLVAGETITVAVRVDSAEAIAGASGAISIYDQLGYELFGTSPRPLGTLPQGESVIEFDIEQIPFLEGSYFVTIGITSADGSDVYGWSDQGAEFKVVNIGQNRGRVELSVDVTVREATAEEHAR